jgi:hypothetical protein
MDRTDLLVAAVVYHIDDDNDHFYLQLMNPRFDTASQIRLVLLSCTTIRNAPSLVNATYFKVRPPTSMELFLGRFTKQKTKHLDEFCVIILKDLR